MTKDKRFAFRLPFSLFRAVEDRAVLHMRSINNEMIVLLKIGLTNNGAESEALEKAEKLLKSYESEKPG